MYCKAYLTALWLRRYKETSTVSISVNSEQRQACSWFVFNVVSGSDAASPE